MAKLATMPALPVRRLASAIEWRTDVNPYRGRRRSGDADDRVRRRRPRTTPAPLPPHAVFPIRRAVPPISSPPLQRHDCANR